MTSPMQIQSDTVGYSQVQSVRSGADSPLGCTPRRGLERGVPHKRGGWARRAPAPADETGQEGP